MKEKPCEQGAERNTSGPTLSDVQKRKLTLYADSVELRMFITVGAVSCLFQRAALLPKSSPGTQILV